MKMSKNQLKEELSKYDFGEKNEEDIGGQTKGVIQTDKYLESKAKAVELIQKDWGLTKGDFWILKNNTKGNWLLYSGLILSHNGCLKINDHLSEDEKFNEKYCSSPIEFETESPYGVVKGMRMEYRDERDGMYEIGEISNENCKNTYPYAMLLKRTMDRVILKKSKVAFSGIYSEAESDEFKEVNN